jgi:hypothetical protein
MLSAGLPRPAVLLLLPSLPPPSAAPIANPTLRTLPLALRLLPGPKVGFRAPLCPGPAFGVEGPVELAAAGPEGLAFAGGGGCVSMCSGGGGSSSSPPASKDAMASNLRLIWRRMWYLAPLTLPILRLLGVLGVTGGRPGFRPRPNTVCLPGPRVGRAVRGPCWRWLLLRESEGPCSGRDARAASSMALPPWVCRL